MLRILIHFEIFIKAGFLLLLLWASYRTVFKKDRPIGLALYIGLVIILDAFYNTGIFLPGLEKGSIKYSEVCAFFLILNNSSDKTPDKSNRIILVLIIIYFVFLFYAGLRGQTLKNGIFYFRRYIVPQIVAFVVARKGFNNTHDYQKFLFYFSSLVILVGLVSFWDVIFDRWLLHTKSLTGSVYWHSRKDGRFGSVFLNPNFLGGFVVLVFPSIFYAFLLEKAKWRKVYILISLLALTFAMIETQSRGPMLAFCVSILAFLLIPNMKYSLSKKLGAFLLIIVILFMAMPGFFEHSIDRFDTLYEETTTEERSRKTIWLYTLKVIGKYPFFGIGIGEWRFWEKMVEEGFLDEFGKWPLDNPHNSYLEIAVYGGIPALMIFLLLNAFLLARSVSTLNRNREHDLSIYLSALLPGFIGFLAALVFDMHLFTQHVGPCYWLFFGLILSIQHALRNQ